MEASNPRRPRHQGRLISPEVNEREACLTFFYHMWGRDSGSLKVKFLTKGGYMDENTWERNGDQGQRWIKAEVNIPIGLTYQVKISYLCFYKTENLSFSGLLHKALLNLMA